ncbi:MAG: Gfo/Idh/MocA family protein [Amphiplicatus sp.]
MVKEIVAGVVGAGVFGGYHANKYAALPGVRLSAVHDVDSTKATSLAVLHGATPYTDYDEFLAQIDVATIASPATTHYALARRALEAGVHVLIEKPMALRVDHADILIELAKEREVVIQAGHQERFVFDAFGVASREAKPRSIWCRRRNPRSGRGEDVSVVFDLMIHDLDLIRRFGLGEIAAIAAVGDFDEIESEIIFANGATALFESSRRASLCDRRMTLVYDDGIIEIDFVKRAVSNTTRTPLPATFNGKSDDPAFADPLGHGVACFLAAVRGEAAPAISAGDGRAAAEWALLIEEAARRPAAPKTSEPLRARA